MITFLRRLLFPISLLYGLVVFVRNFLYDHGLLRSTEFPISIISVGNLSVGGTGKTPHVEYLIRLLKDHYRVATLSRGYGRQLQGFLIASPDAGYLEVGDEPVQYKQKFPDIIVSVCEERVLGIQNLMQVPEKPQVILLDDAFQHRAVKPGLSILLIDYSKVFEPDFIVPTGNLREWNSGIKRANIIIVTKTPVIFSPIEKRRVENYIKLRPHQKLYFSYIEYGNFTPVGNTDSPFLFDKEYYFQKEYAVLLVTGLARPESLVTYIEEHFRTVVHLKFKDHHEFTMNDVKKMEQSLNSIKNKQKIIITTEKDLMRLKDPKGTPQDFSGLLKDLPLFYLPIKIAFHQQEEEFNKQILDFVAATDPHKEV